MSGVTEVVTLRDATDTEEHGGTFTEELSVSIESIREYNSNPLKCRAAYEGPSVDGSHDTEVLSQHGLDVVVRCKCF